MQSYAHYGDPSPCAGDIGRKGGAQPSGAGARVRRADGDAAAAGAQARATASAHLPSPSTTPDTSARFAPQTRAVWLVASAWKGQFSRVSPPRPSSEGANPQRASAPSSARALGPESAAESARLGVERLADRDALVVGALDRRCEQLTGELVVPLRDARDHLALRRAIELRRASGAWTRASAQAPVLDLQQARPRRVDPGGRPPCSAALLRLPPPRRAREGDRMPRPADTGHLAGDRSARRWRPRGWRRARPWPDHISKTKDLDKRIAPTYRRTTEGRRDR